MPIAHWSVLYPNLLSVQLLSFELTPVHLSIQTYDIQNRTQTQVGLVGATQSNKSGFFLFAFRLKSRCIKVFAFIGNRLFLILLSLLPTIFNIRAFGSIKLPLVLMRTAYSFE